MATPNDENGDGDLITRQENEVCVLKSIFGGYCVDLREEKVGEQTQQHQKRKKQSATCDQRRLPVLRITLFPLNSQSQSDQQKIYVQIDLKVEFTPNYPNKLPKLTLENEKGLSNELKKQLHECILKKAKCEIGREIIYELCQDIQEFLYLNNKPPPKSFHEQMLDNQQKLLESLKSNDIPLFDIDNEINNSENLAEINQALLSKRELLREEVKQKRKMVKRERLSSSTNSPSGHHNKTSSNSKTNSESDTKEQEPQQVKFKSFTIDFNEPSINKRKINCVKLVKQIKEYNFKVYRGIDLNTSDVCLVYEWSLSLEKNKIYEAKKYEFCLTEIKKIEEELRKLIKLNDNGYLVKYIAYNYFKTITDKQYFVIQICLSYIEGNTLELFLNKKSLIVYSTIKAYTNELLSILEYLHSNQIFHRDLKASCVHIDNTGCFKLSDYSIVKKINNLYDQVVNDAQNCLIANAKTDIHQLGILLLSLALGESIEDYYPKIPTNLPSEFRTFIQMCISERNDIKSLRNFAFLTQDIDTDLVLNLKPTTITKKSLINTINDEKTDENENKFKLNKNHKLIKFKPCEDEDEEQENNEKNKKKLDVEQESISNEGDDYDDYILDKFNDYPKESRLNTEFEVIGKVGSGAFGEVLKVKNKIDMCTYAIKRIRLNPNSNQLNKQITREIKLLSRLNHENVVRYYSTWIEKYEEEFNETTTDSMSQTNATNTTITKSPIAVTKQQQKEKKVKMNKSSSFSDLVLKTTNFNEPQENNNNNNDDDDDFSASFLLLNQNLKKVTTDSLSSSSSSSSSSTSSSSSGSSSSSSSDDSLISSHESLSESSSESPKTKNNSKPVVFNLEASAECGKNIKKSKKKNKKKSNLKKSKPNNNNDDSSSVIFENDDDDDDEESESEDEDEEVKEEEEEKMKNEENNKIVQIQTPEKRYRLYVYIQMEYCKGRTLKDVIDKMLYKDVDKVWSLFREILQGLNHIHELGMIHRDLKPKNVLIDANGHAKIGDFGLATSKFFLLKSSNSPQSQDSGGTPQHQQHYSASHENLTASNIDSTPADHRNLDSTSLSGGVGTALYVAPELITPKGINKYSYTQKVDIYSLGIMFYEMCFPFSTNMERVHVLTSLRRQEFTFPEEFIKGKDYKNQIELIKEMLQHDPDQRPSARKLLRSDLVPRKANEIALDELLKESLSTRNTNNYRKILKAVFDQSILRKDDVAYDFHNCKQPGSFKDLQLREYVYNTLNRVFQKSGAFMLSYPLLMPTNALCKDYDNSFQLVDPSGMVLTLPYNHRMHFARYLAYSGCNNIKRYFIGNVYKIYSEKLRFIGDHPRENCEASFDIVTPTNADLLPEIETLWILNEAISSFNELADQEFKLVINHSLLLNSIIIYSGIKQDDIDNQKRIYLILSAYNKIAKTQDTSKESKEMRKNWLKEELTKLNFNENIINRLLNCLLKYGYVEEILSELRILTKYESHIARLAKEAINQLKLITQYLSIFEFKYKIYLSTSFVLPLITNPLEYNGLVFALYRKKKKKNDFEIIASGGRYDRLINYFWFKKDLPKPYAVGLSIDFERLVSIINEKTLKQQQQTQVPIQQSQQQASVMPTLQSVPTSVPLPNNIYKYQLVVFSHGLNLSSALTTISTNTNANNRTTSIDQQQLQQYINQLDIKNRLYLFKYLFYLFKSSSICVHFIHEKQLTSLSDIDAYCKRNSILNYIYMNNTDANVIQQISKLFQKYNLKQQTTDQQQLSYQSYIIKNIENEDDSDDYNLNNIDFTVRTLINIKGTLKFVEKKYKLNDFLFNINLLLRTTQSASLYTLSTLPFIVNSSYTFNQSLLANTSTSSLSSIASSTNIFHFIDHYIELILNFTNNKTLATSTIIASNSSGVSSGISNTSVGSVATSGAGVSIGSSISNSNSINVSSILSSSTPSASVLSTSQSSISTSMSQQQQQPQYQYLQTTASLHSFNYISQLNITFLMESTTYRSQSSSVTSSASSSLANNNSLSSSFRESHNVNNSSLGNLTVTTNRGNSNINFKRLETQIIQRLTHVLQLFSMRTRIELIVIECVDSIIQQMSNCLHFDCDEQQFNLNWQQFLDKLNTKCRRQINNFRLEDLLRDLRFKSRSKVFIIYSLRSEQYKLFVAP